MKVFKKIGVAILILAMMLNVVAVSAYTFLLGFTEENPLKLDFVVSKSSVKAGTEVTVDVYAPAGVYSNLGAVITPGLNVGESNVTIGSFGPEVPLTATANWKDGAVTVVIPRLGSTNYELTGTTPLLTFTVNVGTGKENDRVLLEIVKTGDIYANDADEVSCPDDAKAISSAKVNVTPSWEIAGQADVVAEVELGTSLEDAIAKLPKTITVKDATGNYSGTREVKDWTSTTYTYNAKGEYEFTATLVEDTEAASYGPWSPKATVKVTEIAATIEVGVGGIVKYQALDGLTVDDLKKALETSFTLSEGTEFAETVTVEWTADEEDAAALTGAKGQEVTFTGVVQGTPERHTVTVKNAIVQLDNLFAEHEIVATIGADQFNSLQSAVNAYKAGGADIVLYNSSNDTDGATIIGDVVIDLNGYTYAGPITVNSGTLTLKGKGLVTGAITGTVVAPEGYKVVTNDGVTQVISDEFDKAMEVKLEKVEDGVFNIVLYPTDTTAIHEFVSAEFTFTNASKTVGGVADMFYDITAAEGITALRAKEDKADVEGDGDYNDSEALVQTWEFNKNLGNHLDNTDDTSILLGTITFDGYGYIELKVTDGVVHTTKELTNNKYQYVVDGAEDSGLLIIDYAEITGEDGVVEPNKINVTVKVEFPNGINTDVDVDYNAMKVSSVGTYPDYVSETKYFGDDADATNEEGVLAPIDNVKVNAETGLVEATAVFEVYTGSRYTFTLEGAGYRTTRYSINIDKAATEDVVLTFWNNVKYDEDDAAADGVTGSEDPAKPVEVGGKTYTKNFLAGDIAMDNIIDKYDLAAAVSYFGTYELSATNKAEYVKYDLNRDGKIDSEDIAYVLYSIGE